MRCLPLAPLHPLPIALSPSSAPQQREEEEAEEAEEVLRIHIPTLHPSCSKAMRPELKTTAVWVGCERRFEQPDAEAATEQDRETAQPLKHLRWVHPPAPPPDQHRRSSESICRRVDHSLAERQPRERRWLR